MNVRCDPDKGGCGTLFTPGAAICPHCQRPAENVATPNIENLQPRELDAIDESEVEDVSDLVPRRRRPQRVVELPKDEQETTDE